jgi:membrane associated rhomboid family serine protease
MKYLFTLIFIAVFCLFDVSTVGYTDTSPIYTHFTYMWQHINIWHLIINSFCFIGFFRTLEKIINKWTLAVSIIANAFLGSFLVDYKIAVAGCSGMIYAMLGIYCAIIAARRLIITNASRFYIFILCVIISLTVSFFKENSAFELHIVCLVCGFCPFFIKYKIKNKNNFS